MLQVVDLPKPEPGDGEVLIEVSRAGMNFADTHQRENSYLARYEVPLVLGGEVVGHHAGRAARGRAAWRPVATPSTPSRTNPTVFPIPDGMDDGAALALLIQGLTAWHLFQTSAKLAQGESVVVISGAGGVGSLAVQLAKPFGAGRVIATASTEEKRAQGARAGRRRRGGRGGGGPEGRADRGERGQAGGRRARDVGRARVRRSAPRRSLRSGGSWPTASRAASRTRSRRAA